MPRTIRFHLDEHCNPAIAAGMRRRGVDVTTTTEAGLLHASDQQHVAYALGQGRVIFTQDQDFLRIHAAGIPHAGIAYCHQQSHQIGEIIDDLTLLWEVLEPEEMRGRVEFL
jgi:predicted nuclease of predicted toxin-antitoxin system